MRSVAVAALAALGALVIHQLAYLMAYPLAEIRAERLETHGHLTVQWALITPIAVLAAASLILRQVKNLRIAPDVRIATLTALSGTFFVLQEAIEATVGEGSLLPLVSSPTVIGVLLAPVVATAMLRVLHRATEFVAALLAAPPRISFPAVIFPRPVDERRSSRDLVTGTSPRGPPVLTS